MATVWAYIFASCPELIEINKPLDLSNVTSIENCFSNCFKLKEIRFVESSIKASLNIKDCSLLSAASIENIINGLVDLTDNTSQVLSLHEDIKAKLTDEQIATITNKNWTLA